MGWIGDSGFWIGKHETLGLVVIDSTDDRDGGTLSVFLFEQNRRANFISGDVFNDVRVSAQIAQSGIDALIAERLDRRHREFLSKHGRVAADIRKRPSNISRRLANCFHCHKRLDSNISYECAACGWILCECGACGCTHGGGQFKSSLGLNPMDSY